MEATDGHPDPEIPAILQELQIKSKLIQGAKAFCEHAKCGVKDFMGSAVAPLLVHIATTHKDSEVVCAAIMAMTAMAAWPEGRCELRICGCLRVLEVCTQSTEHPIRSEGLRLLSNLAIDQVITQPVWHPRHMQGMEV